ncbi:MAG: signal recognition particle-docking protein FtsY [Victivallales bacterium]|nr:signal recognition particle-docking protein FtsY [Victivallales bacterium]
MPSLFERFKQGLERTKTSLLRGLQGLFGGAEAWNDETYAKLEASLIATDLGVGISQDIVKEIRNRYERGLIATEADIMAVGKEKILGILDAANVPPMNQATEGPTVIMMVGVNGSGKTTTTAKLAYYFKEQGKSVMLAAGDTFRAAGIEQLCIWGERLGVPVVAGKHGGDAAALAFDAVKSATQKNCDYLIIDTAGRQHTRKDLMEELSKVKRVIAKANPAAPHEIWLTVDASTGTNALIQAREFGKLFPITGLVLTKLDGTGRGGIAVAIKQELGHPVRFVGLGEQKEDLQPFDVTSYVDALFS